MSTTASATISPETAASSLPVVTASEAGFASEVTVPGGLLVSADYARNGNDLILTAPDGRTLVIQGYFAAEVPPDLVGEGGGRISGDLAGQLAGPRAPGQYAQAGPVPAAEPIGKVETLDGPVTATRADGTKVTLAKGDPVFQGDTLETGKKGAVGIVFADDSTFSLGDGGKMVLDELVYDPGDRTGKAAFSVMQGVFTFVSGQIAKTETDAMTIHTPTATIGIRGTAGSGRIGAQGHGTFALMEEVDPTSGQRMTGEMVIRNGAGFQVLNQPFQATTVVSFNAAPSQTFTMTPQDFGRNFGSTITNLPGADRSFSSSFRESVHSSHQETRQQEARLEQAQQAQDKTAAPTGDGNQPAGGEGTPEGDKGPAGEGGGNQPPDGGPLEGQQLAALDSTLQPPGGVGGLPGGAPPPTGEGPPAGLGEPVNFGPDIDPATAFNYDPGQGLGFNPGSTISGFNFDPNQGGLSFDPNNPNSIMQPTPGQDPNAEGENGPPGTADDPFANFNSLDPFAQLGIPPGFGPGDFLDPFALPEPDFGLPEENTVNTPLGPIQTEFEAAFTGTTGVDNFVGTGVNTNFYFPASAFPNSTIATHDQVSNTGFSQLSFDGLENTRIRIEMTAAANGQVSYYTNLAGSGSASIIDFTGVKQYLFSDTTVAGLGGGYAGGQQEPTGTTSSAPSYAGDIIVFPAMDNGDKGTVLAGTGGAEVLTVNDATWQLNLLAFGKGGGDTFSVGVGGNHILIGGATLDDNNDAGSDRIPDSNINVFTYASLDSGVAGAWAGAGILAALFADGQSATAGRGGGDALVQDQSGSGTNLRDMLWDVGSFLGSQYGDTLTIKKIGANAAGFATVDTGTGNDTVEFEMAASNVSIGNLAGGVGNDTLSLVNFSTGVSINMTAGTITGATTVNVLSSFETILGSTGDDTIIGTTGADNITGGMGNDTITGGDGGDTLTGGIGDDLFKIDDNDIGANEIISDVGGTDTLLLLGGGGGSVALTNSLVTGIEIFDLSNGPVGGVALLADGADLADATAIIGTSGANDRIDLFSSTSFTNVAFTGIEKVDFASDAVYAVTLGDGNVSAGGTLTITSTGVTTSTNTVTVDGSNETNGHLSITGAAGTDNLKGGAGNDVLVGGAGADVLAGNAGADTFTGGGGADSISLGAGDGVADVIKYLTTGDLGDSSISGFVSGVDKFDFDDIGFGFGSAHALTNAEFVTVGGAPDVNTDNALGAGPGFIFDSTNHVLYYDSDGNTGDAAYTSVATVDGNVAYTDIGIT